MITISFQEAKDILSLLWQEPTPGKEIVMDNLINRVIEHEPGFDLQTYMKGIEGE